MKKVRLNLLRNENDLMRTRILEFPDGMAIQWTILFEKKNIKILLFNVV